ncbi:MAG: metallophosphoesterase family protein [Desulfatibacillaceae bacterium]|nr:metallophosphoesterase family protein [Desulfatibacillaceae bacterium]
MAFLCETVQIEVESDAPAKVGVMADSHGEPEALLKGVKRLSELGCSLLIHLGDVVDSARPETADTCAGVLISHGVYTVKGNNDHQIVASHDGRPGGPVSEQTVQWLKNLPCRLLYQKAVFVHSLPYVGRMGLSALARSMDPPQMLAYLSGRPAQFLFRGHSHSPLVAHLEESDNRKKLATLTPPQNQALDAAPLTPCIVTCGALSNNLCLVWEPKAGFITSIRI